MVISTKFLRRSVLLAAVAALFACVAAASAGAAPRVFVGNWAGESVSAINSQTNGVVGEPIPVGENPASIAVTPNGRYAYVTNRESGTVSVINTQTLQPVGKAIPVGVQPEEVAISPDGTRAYVAVYGSKDVAVISTATNVVIGRVEVDSEPTGVAVTPSGASVWVAEPGAGAVEVINAATDKVVGSPIEVGGRPETIAFTPDGKTAYLAGELTGKGEADEPAEEVFAVGTGTRLVTPIKVGLKPFGIAVTPDGSKVFVANPALGTVSVISTASNQVVGEIPVGGEPEGPYEVAITPDGKTAYVSVYKTGEIRQISVQTNQLTGSPIKVVAEGPFPLAITPDQSPTAAFTPPASVLFKPTAFSGAASTDPDGTISSYAWAFGDGGTATGAEASHTYTTAGEYSVKLSVVDNEGCSEAEVFTGRTAYCSGAASSVSHTVTAYPPPNNFGFKRLIHNRNNGTVRMQVKLPGEGELILTGPQVHMVRKKKAPAGLVWMTIHPRVEVGKRLKKINHLRINVHVKFTPVGGTAKTKSRSLQLLRRAKKKHHHHS
jgi:YVTN family beta-propeller protein